MRVFITDYECDYIEIGEYDNLNKLNEIAEAMEDTSSDCLFHFVMMPNVLTLQTLQILLYNFVYEFTTNKKLIR